MTVFEAYKAGIVSLAENGVENAEFDAKLLLLFSLGITKEEYALNKNEPCDNTRLEIFFDLIKKRSCRVPLQYLLGKWEFCGNEFIVSPLCLIPRPETELTVNAALSLGIENCRFADMCTGSGCIGISYAKAAENSRGFLLDISSEALSVAEENAELNNVSDRIEIRRFDVFSDELCPDIDLLMSNPPYIPKKDMLCLQPEVKFEPEIALYGGEDGLDFYRRICSSHVTKLKSGAYVIFELGISQYTSVCKMLENSGCNIIQLIKDDGGIERTVVAKRK